VSEVHVAAGSLRGAVLNPAADGRLQVWPCAEVRWVGGRISEVVACDGPADRVLLPGFVDLHCHWPQSHVRGQFGGQLLPWLRGAIWPAEAAFADPSVASARAEAFLAELLRAGTCAGLLFGPPFLDASLTLLERAPRGFFDGPALMECNAPDALLAPVASTLDQLATVAPEVRRRLVVSPRFAPNVTAAGLDACGQVATRWRLAVQSHLSENLDEVAWVRALFPEALDYTDVYDRSGLLGPRTVMAHGIHLSERELARLAATGTWVAHCPTSNEALQSGRMPLERLRAAGVSWVLATDIGAGPLLSQLDAMRAFVEIHRGFADATATEALARATVLPGQFLAQLDPACAGLGTLTPDAPAHVVALPLPPGHAGPRTSDDAEALLRAMLHSPRANLETLPCEVVCWGRTVAGA
jgi:guanine deaminase